MHKVTNNIQLSWADVYEESTVGVGGFSRVSKVQVNQLEGNYALKSLTLTTLNRRRGFRTGAVDLVMEGEILARLSHENIIQLHGVTAGGPLKAYTESERGYFIVLDLLEDTLRNKLDKNRRERQRRHYSRRSTTETGSALERIQTVALGVAKGLQYMHSQGVVLRDLKPDNVGFDKNGTPKIFDLGFAREVQTIHAKEVAGSLRYMAPEVAFGRVLALLLMCTPLEYYSGKFVLWKSPSETFTQEKNTWIVSPQEAGDHLYRLSNGRVYVF